MTFGIIGCKTLERELLRSMEVAECDAPVLWVDSGLHNWPDKLRGRIQELLDSCRGVDTVLLAMSLCGNALVGLETGAFSLVVPRCDDCIDLLLGSRARRREFPGTYFLTEGWLTGERNLWQEYRLTLEKYGDQLGREIFSTMLAHYRQLALLDTGCFSVETLEPEVRRMAEELGLESVRLEGTLAYLTALLTPPWNPRQFLIVPPRTKITPELCLWKG